jgi:hypothetical protein
MAIKVRPSLPHVAPSQPEKPKVNTLIAKSIKCTLVLSAAEILSIAVPEGQPRCSVRIAVAGRTVTADLNAKSVRRAIANIRQAGPDNVACILQGRLDANNALLDAGLAIQLKTKPESPTKEPSPHNQ